MARTINRRQFFALAGTTSAAFALGGALFGCSPSNNATPSASESASSAETASESTAASGPIEITLGVPTAPPTLPILRMIDSKALGEDVTINLDVWTAPDQLIAMVQDSAHDMFAFPLTVVATLFNKGLDVRLMNVNTWGVTYFLTTDPNFGSWSDLKGKTVHIPLQSSPPDALTQYFINEAGLVPGEDVEIIYATTDEVTQLLASGQAQYATQIEPQVTAALSKNPNLRRALSFEEEWQRVTGTDTMIPNAGFGTKQSFIDENPDFVAAFQNAYQEALEWVVANPAEAAKLAEAELGMQAALVEQAIPNMGLHFKTAPDAADELADFYELLYSYDPSMVGGNLPGEEMYYQA